MSIPRNFWKTSNFILNVEEVSLYVKTGARNLLKCFPIPSSYIEDHCLIHFSSLPDAFQLYPRSLLCSYLNSIRYPSRSFKIPSQIFARYERKILICWLSVSNWIHPRSFIDPFQLTQISFLSVSLNSGRFQISSEIFTGSFYVLFQIFSFLDFFSSDLISLNLINHLNQWNF